MTNHILGDINRNKLIAIMNSNSVTNKIRRNHRCSSPSLYNILFTTFIHGKNLFLKRDSYIRAFF